MTRGMSLGEIREDEVISSYLAHLADTGRSASLRERPDRIPEAERRLPNITSDALVELDRESVTEWWAMDVMALAAPHTHAQFPKELDKALRRVALASQLNIVVSGEFADIQEVNGLIAAVRAGTAARPSGSLELGGATATWNPAGPGDADLDLAIILPTPSAKLVDQIEITIRAPLHKKVTQQAARALAAGCKAAVLLDGPGHPGIAQGTHWLSQRAETYRLAVEAVLAGIGDHLDLVAYLDRGERWHTLYGGI
jgi:hypothetical protein